MTSAGLQGKAHCTHTASEKRQSSPGWASEEAGPGQDCSGESGLGDSEAGWLAPGSAMFMETVVLLRLAL